MSTKTLHDLYAEHTGNSSDKWSSYITEYDRLFTPYRREPVSLLEIGVQNGGSLEIWSKYFSNATAIVGSDIDPRCETLTYEDPNIHIVIGDITNSGVSNEILKASPAFDIIIDDGSHRSSDIIKTFLLYFRHLKDGGMFIAEDLHCSYWSKFEGGLFHPYSAISFFKRLADIINHQHWGISKDPQAILRGTFANVGCSLEAETLSQIHSIEFMNSMCVVRKASPPENVVGHRVIAGSYETIVQGNLELQGTSFQLDPILDQSGNPWTAMDVPPDEALPQTIEALVDVQDKHHKLQEHYAVVQRKVGNLEQHISTLGQQCVMLGDQLSEIRNSASWRMTAPLRTVGDVGKSLYKKVKMGPLTRPNLRSSVLAHGHRFYRSYMKGTRLGRFLGQQALQRGFISHTEVQIASFANMGGGVPTDAPPDGASVETDTHVSGFHLSPPLNITTSDNLALRPCINVLLPSLRPQDMSGGPNTALVLATLLAELGEDIRLIACDIPMEQSNEGLLRHMDGLLQRPVARESLELVDATNRSVPIEIGVNDVFLATAWWTAQLAKYAQAKTAPHSFIYLIQDFEPILHEGSTLQARSLETYSLPHIPVINSKLLLDHLAKEGAGRYADPEFVAQSLWFEPALDRNYYFPERHAHQTDGKRNLLFYARPTFARRNLFELGVVALRQAVASGAIDKDNWNVWAMGEKLDPVPLGNGVFLNPVPWLDLDAYAKRMRSADLLLSLMLSPHPSYPPLEMAAAGNIVVTNSYSVKTAQRMRAISPNIIVTPPVAEAVASALENAAGRINAGLPAYDPSGALSLPSNWDQSMADLVPELVRRVRKLRETSPNTSMQCSPGLPKVATNEYEAYRKQALLRRRQEGPYSQEQGLLSFITSAYNTDPAFLEELGSSMFRQDGGTDFEWLILDNGSTNEATRLALQALANHPCVRLKRVEHNLGIIGGMRFCLEHATGRYILPLDSDDLLELDAVHVLTRFIQAKNFPALLYTDEDKLAGGHFGSPYFKPDWDPVLFVHSCYIAHLCAIDRAEALAIGLYTDSTAEGCHDWDSFIRFMHAGHVPQHIPEVLYSWRVHEASTSGNISSKSYIADSHRSTLQRFLDHSGASDIELVSSPLFHHNVDWWFRRKRINPLTIQTVVIDTKALSEDVSSLADIVKQTDCELLHLRWNEVQPNDDEWQWDAMAMMQLFPDTVMVGGLLHDGDKIVDGPRVFGFGAGYDCPDRGRTLGDPGYGARMWKHHTTSAVSAAHCVIRTSFFRQCTEALLSVSVVPAMLGPWLGALAHESRCKVIYSPFMRARTKADTYPISNTGATHETFLSRFWSLVPDTRVYSPRLGLDSQHAYQPVPPAQNHRHRLALHESLLPYAKWLAMHMQTRSRNYSIPDNRASLSIITTVYEGTDIGLLDALAGSVTRQTLKAMQWIIVVHGSVSEQSTKHIRQKAGSEWEATLVESPQSLGIAGAMRKGLEHARGDYIVPVDADDLLTSDALHILASAIANHHAPVLVFSDEDALSDGVTTAPYLRSRFDPVLNLDSSYIWHVCAINRECANRLGLYTDPGATWCHDWDTIMRIANAKGRIEHVPEILYHWRQHRGSTTNNAGTDSPSLTSVRYVLEQHIQRLENPQKFFVADWPRSRGTRELYIARQLESLPPFVWAGDLSWVPALSADDNAILVYASSGIIIDSQKSFVEAARLFELHPHVGAVGGSVIDSDKIIVDGCYVATEAGTLESPWLAQTTDYAGPYALALKTQTVAATGAAFAFFRVSALRQAGTWPAHNGTTSLDLPAQLCERLSASGWAIAFSPLLEARAGTGYRLQSHRTLAGSATRRPNILGRYGMVLPYRHDGQST